MQIEAVGGKYEDGRHAIERLKSSLEEEGTGGDEVTVMQQIDNIRRRIELLESRVEGMSDEAYGIISIAGNDSIELIASRQPKEDMNEEINE